MARNSVRRGARRRSCPDLNFCQERRGGNDLAAAARRTDLILFCILSAELKGILVIFIPKGF